MDLRFRGCPPTRALSHRRPIKSVLQRGKAHTECRPDADTDERKPADAGRPVALLLEHDWVCREERVQDGICHPDVDREERNDGLRREEHCNGREVRTAGEEVRGTHERAVRGWCASTHRDRASA